MHLKQTSHVHLNHTKYMHLNHRKYYTHFNHILYMHTIYIQPQKHLNQTTINSQTTSKPFCLKKVTHQYYNQTQPT